MTSNNDFIHIVLSVPWPVYGFSQTSFHLVAVGRGQTVRGDNVVGIDLTYKGYTDEQTNVFIDITTLNAHDRINILGAQRSLEANLDLRLNQDYRLFKKYQLDEELRKSLGTPQIVQVSFSVLERDFDGKLHIWPSLSLSRFLLFQKDVTVQGDIRGLQKEQLCELLKMIVPINTFDFIT